MDDLIPLHQAQSDADGVSEVPHQPRTEANKLVLLDQLVEVDGHELEHETSVTSEDETVLDVDNVASVGLVFSQQLLQYLHFSLCLLQEPLVISDNLERGILLGLVIIHLDNLTK